MYNNLPMGGRRQKPKKNRPAKRLEPKREAGSTPRASVSGVENHGNGKTESTTQEKNEQPQYSIGQSNRRRIRMDVIAYSLGALAGIAFTLFGIWYQSHKSRAIILFGVGVVFTTAALCVLWLDKAWKSEEAARLTAKEPMEGLLVPGNGPTPPHPCQAGFEEIVHSKRTTLSDNAVAIHYGNSAAMLDKKSRFTLIRVGTDELLSITKNPDGISVSAKVFSSDSRIIAQIIDNSFHINSNNYFRIDRPTRHILTVYDQQANRVLHVEFVNKHLIKTYGVFHYPNGSHIVIDETSIKVGTLTLTNYCSFDSDAGIEITPEGIGIK